MSLPKILRVLGVCLALSLVSLHEIPPASAHLATFGSWEVTKDYLEQLFPGATRFQVKSYKLDDAKVARIEKELGFELYPEDKTPSFYIAVQEKAGKRRVLGVAMFIDPRVEPKTWGGEVVRLEVGIAVNTRGQIHKVRVFDYRGNLALTRPAFLDQLNSKSLKSSFKVGKGVKAVEGEAKESQLVANAAHEALFLMKVVLGK